ncbi:hypothetical protein [Methylobacterium aquaticum]|jgi:hypothetical protein|uniref:hypothetical protein n=1 Tax=Methylobacterium aquaticum TaxID=270351 RepID=UPI000AFC0B95|nr:hypothetical protein [Methylobacterium aquaticum]
MKVAEVFKQCVEAMRAGKLIVREGRNEKEFHFQNWFVDRLDELGMQAEIPGRISYPDFWLVDALDGFELKALGYPGRNNNFDCNSQVPRGGHGERTVYYVFGRYPKNPDGNSYPLLDLVICHGNFLSVDTSYKHENKNFRGVGSYGDIQVRDRKMYVVPTPYALADGTAHARTLILPADQDPGEGFVCVGDLRRREVDEVVVAYQFDLKTNVLTTRTEPNPGRGREHPFKAWRLDDDPGGPVTLKTPVRRADRATGGRSRARRRVAVQATVQKS